MKKIKKEQIVEIETAFEECVLTLMPNTEFDFTEGEKFIEENHNHLLEEYKESGDDLICFVHCEAEDLIDEVTTIVVNTNEQTIKDFNKVWEKYKKSI